MIALSICLFDILSPCICYFPPYITALKIFQYTRIWSERDSFLQFYPRAETLADEGPSKSANISMNHPAEDCAQKRYILYKKIYLMRVKSSIHQICDMQQQKANKGGVITNSLRNNYSRHHLYTRTRRSWAISTGHPAEFFRIHILVRGQSLCIADICPNHTTGGGVLFWAKVLFSLGVLAHFDQFRLFCCEFTHFSVYFSQA